MFDIAEQQVFTYTYLYFLFSVVKYALSQHVSGGNFKNTKYLRAENQDPAVPCTEVCGGVIKAPKLEVCSNNVCLLASKKAVLGKDGNRIAALQTSC